MNENLMIMHKNNKYIHNNLKPGVITIFAWLY